jgi:branched-chain amino acid transport system permease protein
MAQQTVNWLTLGGIYALIALGIAVVFSVLGLINFAHGELITVAGYTMFLLLGAGAPLVLVVPASIAAAGLAAVVMERIVFRPLRGASMASLILGSLALSLVLQNLFLLTAGARPKALDLPAWTNAHFDLGGVVVKYMDVATWVVTAVILVGVVTFLRRSVRGLALRAAAEDFPVTRLMGINATAVVRGAFLLSGLLAGVAAFFYLANASLISPSTGFNPVLKGFIAAVIGGLGSLSGAVLGGFALAAIETFFTLALPETLAPMVQAFVFGLVILVLLLRPQGLLAARSLSADRA